MEDSGKSMSRRTAVRVLASSTLFAFAGCAQYKTLDDLLAMSDKGNSNKLWQDEAYWAKIRRYYDATIGIVNLEHGYWGKMARPVQDYYLSATKMVNAQNSFYARKDYKADHKISVQRVAKALGVHEDEIALTRNATESIHNLIRQYRGLKQGDTVLYSDVDYPSFKTAIRWLEHEYKVEVALLKLPVKSNQQEILQMYIDAFDANPSLKMMLLTHVSNQHGMVLPVKSIMQEARKRNIDVICDNAQSWGLMDYKVPDLDLDFAGFNLHKWIGTPLGVGALYIRRGSLHKIAPYPGEKDSTNTDISTRVHTATSNFAAMLTIPTALDFHETIGPPNKEARLNYLRKSWTSEAEKMPHIQVLGGTDEASRTGMASFRLAGKNTIADANELQKQLENEFGIFTVIRKGLDSGGCVRITPQVFNTPEEMELLLNALRKL